MFRKSLAVSLALTILWTTSWATGRAVAAPIYGLDFSLNGLGPTVASGELKPLPSLTPNWELDFDAPREAAYAVADRYDPGRYFVEDLLERLDYDSTAAFEFVRDEIRVDPYQGVLRGVEGVLGGQAGNAYDRSLLLKQLLEDMGFEARLAFGALTDELAGKLMAHALQSASVEIDIEPLAKLAGLIPQVQQRMLSRVQRDYAWLNQALQGEELSGQPRTIDKTVLKDHVWVQAKLEGEWSNLDSSFPDARVGAAYAEPRRFGSEASPEDYHSVSLQVVAEALHGDRLVEESLLTMELPAASAVRNRIYLHFVPTNPTIGGVLNTKLGGQAQFKPILTVDGEVTAGERLPGISEERSESADFLFEKGSSSELTALYLQVQTTGPGLKASKSRRCLLDRVPARTRIGRAVTFDDLLTVQKIDGTPKVFHAVHQILVSNGGLNPHQVANNIGLAIYFTGTYLSDEENAKQLPLDSIMWPIAMLRAAPLAVNEHLAIASLNDKPGLRFLIARPRVYLMSQSVEPGETEDLVGFSVDLLSDDVEAVAAENIEPTEVALRRLWYGVFQSAFETTMLERSMMITGITDGLVSASADVRGEPLLIASGTDSRLPPQPPVALLGSLEKGEMVVASRDSLNAGVRTWWSISPDGTTRAMLAPTLGGGHWSTRWGRWTNNNPHAKAKPTNTSYNPDNMSQRQIQSEQQRAIREAMQDANKKADSKYKNSSKHMQKVKRGGKLPQARARSGHTEDSLMQMAATWMTTNSALVLGLVLVATLIAAFIYISGFVALF